MLLVVGVLLITSGVRRLRKAAVAGADANDDMRWSGWARIGIGGGLLLFLFGPESAVSTLGTAAGLSIAALAGWYLWQRPSVDDPAVVRRLAGAVGIVLGTAVVALFVGESAITVRTTTDDGETPVLPSATDARVSRVDCPVRHATGRRTSPRSWSTTRPGSPSRSSRRRCGRRRMAPRPSGRWS